MALIKSSTLLSTFIPHINHSLCLSPLIICTLHLFSLSLISAVLSGWVWGGSENSEIGDRGSRSGLENRSWVRLWLWWWVSTGARSKATNLIWAGLLIVGFVLIWVYFGVGSGFLYLWGEWIRWNCGLQWGSILEDENASFSSSDPKFLVTCRAKESNSAITVSAHSGHDTIHFLQ